MSPMQWQGSKNTHTDYECSDGNESICLPKDVHSHPKRSSAKSMFALTIGSAFQEGFHDFHVGVPPLVFPRTKVYLACLLAQSTRFVRMEGLQYILGLHGTECRPLLNSVAVMSAILLAWLLILPGTAAAPTLEWLSKYINCSTMESIDSRFLRGATKVQDWSGGKVCLLPLN